MMREQKFIANGNGTDSMAKTLFDRALPKFGKTWSQTGYQLRFPYCVSNCYHSQIMLYYFKSVSWCRLTLYFSFSQRIIYFFQSVSWCRLTLYFSFSQRILYFFPKCKLMSSNSAAFPTSGWSSRVEAAAGHKVFFAFCTFPFWFKTHTENQTPMKQGVQHLVFFRTLSLGGWGSKVLNFSVKKTHDVSWHIWPFY